MKTLLIIPCGSRKIWSKKPCLFRVPAKNVYIGSYTLSMLRYAEQSGLPYYIFSGMYGLIHPDTLLNDYDSGGKLRKPFKELEKQAQKLKEYDKIITLCNKEFNQTLEKLFPQLEYFYPDGLMLGQKQAYLKQKRKELL